MKPVDQSALTSEPIEIVRRCFQAYVADDREALEGMIASDFAFTSPLDNRLDRATYFARCWPNHEWMTGVEFVRLVASGETVIATYEGSSSRGEGFRNTEVFTIRNRQIVEVEVYFGWSLPHEAPKGG